LTFSLALALCAGGAHAGAVPAHDNAFRSGWSLLEKEQYAEARAAFGAIPPQEYDLGDYVVFFGGMAAAREGDRKAASEAAETLEGRFPGSPLVPYLAHEIAFAAALDNDLPAARKALALSLGKVEGNGRKAEEGFVAARLAGEGEPTPASAALHLENFSAYTAQAAATRSYDLLWQWWQEGRIAAFDLPVGFYGKLANAANRAGDAERARRVYEEAVRRFPPSDGYYAMVLDFAEFHRRRGETSEASALLAERLADAPPAFRSDMQFLQARIDWKAGKLADAKSRFLEIAEGSTRAGTADRARYYAAWIAEDEEDLSGATGAFGRLRRAEDDRIRQEALFRYAYGLYRQKAFDNAAAAFDQGEGGGFGTVEIARHRFWRARALRAAGRAQEADLLLAELADDPYAGVYALFAVKERGGDPFGMLNARSSRETRDCGQERDRLWAKVRGAAWAPADAEKVRRADRLVHLGVVDYAVLEAQRVDPSAARKAIGLADGGAPGLVRYLAGDLKGAIRETGPLPLDPANPGLIDRIQYPLAPEFLKDCDRPRSGIDPLVLHAIIRQESAFQADALSPAGAIGLMQLMPRTAAETARREKLPRPRRLDLTRPALNVQLGAAYLSRLLNGSEGDYFRAIAAYNSGESAVRRWWAAAGGDPATYLERISYRETRLYVRRVFFNLLQYYRIYRPGMFALHFPTVPAEAPPASGAAPIPAPSGSIDNVPSTPPTPEAVPSDAPPPTPPDET
jgi:soluble lytic murein transglycosylase-like protein